VIENYRKSDCKVYSLADSYVGENYSIDCSFLLIDSKFLNILDIGINNKFNITKFLVKNKISFGSYFEMNKEREIFWSNLFVDIFEYPEILIKNNCPLLKRKNLRYIINSIPKNFKKTKTKTKINSWFALNNMSKEQINKIFNINIDEIKTCVVFHCSNLNELEEYQKEIEKLKKLINFDIYITTNSKSTKKDNIYN
jgi:hypothetical protein